MTSSRDLNRARVFEIIHLFEPISRTEIAHHIGLTSASISYIVAELLELGFILELGRRSGTRGQPAIELGVAAAAAHTIGLHFSLESIRGAVVDLKGRIVVDERVELSRSPTPSEVLDTLIAMGERLKAQVPGSKPLAVGLASVGPIDLVQGCVTQTAFTVDWHNVALRQPLAEALSLPVYMDNNATAAAIGEYWYGIGRKYKNFLHVTFFGSGLGGGLFLNRRVYRGAGLNAAEFGHLLVQPRNKLQGIPAYLENYVSGHALRRDLGEDVMHGLHSRIEQGEQSLGNWLDEAGEIFASTLVTVDHLLNLDAISIGGQMPASFIEALLQRVGTHLDDLYMPGWSKRACIRQCRTGDDSAVLGAATLPIYDVLAVSVHGSRATTKLFKSDVSGELMH